MAGTLQGAIQGLQFLKQSKTSHRSIHLRGHGLQAISRDTRSRKSKRALQNASSVDADNEVAWNSIVSPPYQLDTLNAGFECSDSCFGQSEGDYCTVCVRKADVVNRIHLPPTSHNRAVIFVQNFAFLRISGSTEQMTMFFRRRCKSLHPWTLVLI